MFKKLFGRRNTEEKESKKEAAKRMMEGNFTLNDFVKQLNMLDKLGSLQKFARFIPGMGNVSPEMIEKGKAEAKQFQAIIDVMTEQERDNPKILNALRKQEIAQQSGTSVQIVNHMLEKFEQSKQFVKMFKNSGGTFNRS